MQDQTKNSSANVNRTANQHMAATLPDSFGARMTLAWVKVLTDRCSSSNN